jgi:hypothetical protein
MGKQVEAVKDKEVSVLGATKTEISSSKDLDEKSLESPELLTSVTERLENLGEITRSERSGTRLNPAAEPDDDDSPIPDEDGKTTEVATKDTGEKGLPDAYVRAAVMYGWKEADALEYFKANPERALVTFESIYNTRNKASAEFAALGRRAKEAPVAKPVERPVFKPADTSQLKEKYGEDAAPLIEMIEAQNRAMEQVMTSLPQPPAEKDNTARSSAVEESGIEQRIHSFFESDSMKPYAKVYGNLGLGMTLRDLTPGQQEFRCELLTRADQIAGGAHLQDVTLSLEEALEMANLLVTQRYRDQILIDGLKENVVRREKSFTLKPSDGVKTARTAVDEKAKPGSRNREKLLTDTEQRLSKMFGG